MKKRIKKIKKKSKKLLKKLRVRSTSSLFISLFLIGLMVALVGSVLAVSVIATPFILVWWVWRQVFLRKREQQSNLNSAFYQLLQDNCGQVTLLDFALKTNLTGLEAKQYLDQRAQEFMADFEVTQKGEIVYCFADLGQS
jgi:hypothetical protein